jgi:hypothetical protein
MSRRSRSARLCLAVALALATGCPPANPTIVAPKPNALLDDPGVAIEIQVPRRFVHDATIVRVDGVDLVAALGLVPPFAGAAGNVAIGGDVVAVSGFDYVIPPTGVIVIRATLAGLASADHLLEAEAFPSAGGDPTERSRAFAVVEPMTLEAEVIASAGTPAAPPVPANHAGNATLGEPLAAAPVALANDAGSVRAGYVPAAQARAGHFDE